MTRLVVVGLLVLGVDSGTGAQRASPLLLGRVVADIDSAPLRRARVAVLDSPDTAILTDGAGRFALPVPPGTGPRLLVSKGGYASTIVEVPRGANETALEVRLERGASVSGRVLDPSGVPAVGAAVVARPTTDATTRTTAPRFDAMTDDRGEYRLFGLSAGSYTVTAGHGMIFGRPQLLEYALANLSSPAQRVEVRPGEDLGPVDFEVDLPRPTTMAVNPRGRVVTTAVAGSASFTTYARNTASGW